VTVIFNCSGDYRADPGDFICVARDAMVEGIPSEGSFLQEWYVDDCKQSTTGCQYLVRPSDNDKVVSCVQTYVDDATGDRIPLPRSNGIPIGRWLRKTRPVCRNCGIWNLELR